MKILIAIDGSSYGAKALDYVLSHAQQFGQAELTVIHVGQAVPMRAAAAVGADIVASFHAHEHDEALAGARARLKAAARQAREVKVVGDPAAKIIEEIEAGQQDLVVMGSHGQGAVAGLLLGSVVTKLLARSRVPVLVVR
jgi:nucleotide-binding universal stress UspA family protein